MDLLTRAEILFISDPILAMGPVHDPGLPQVSSGYTHPAKSLTEVQARLLQHHFPLGFSSRIMPAKFVHSEVGSCTQRCGTCYTHWRFKALLSAELTVLLGDVAWSERGRVLRVMNWKCAPLSSKALSFSPLPGCHRFEPLFLHHAPVSSHFCLADSRP